MTFPTEPYDHKCLEFGSLGTMAVFGRIFQPDPSDVSTVQGEYLTKDGGWKDIWEINDKAMRDVYLSRTTDDGISALDICNCEMKNEGCDKIPYEQLDIGKKVMEGTGQEEEGISVMFIVFTSIIIVIIAIGLWFTYSKKTKGGINRPMTVYR